MRQTFGAQPERNLSAFKRTKEQSNGQLMSVESRDGTERKFRGRLSGRIRVSIIEFGNELFEEDKIRPSVGYEVP